jgi:hypothetical protein
VWARVQREPAQELDRAISGPAARLRRLGRAAGTGDAKAGPGALGSRCRRPVMGGGPDLAAVGAGRIGRPWWVRDRQLAALLINVSGPLGVCHDSRGPRVLIIRTCADPLYCRRRERQLTRTKRGGCRGWRWTWPLGHGPGVSQRMITTSGPFRLWRNTKWPQALIIRHTLDPRAHASGTSVRSAPKVGQRHIAESPVSGTSLRARSAVHR